MRAIWTGVADRIEYLRDGENALVVRGEDPAAWAAAVARLAGDERLRARLRAGGLRTAARFPAGMAADAVAGALEDIVGRSRVPDIKEAA